MKKTFLLLFASIFLLNSCITLKKYNKDVSELKNMIIFLESKNYNDSLAINELRIKLKKMDSIQFAYSKYENIYFTPFNYLIDKLDNKISELKNYEFVAQTEFEGNYVLKYNYKWYYELTANIYLFDSLRPIDKLFISGKHYTLGKYKTEDSDKALNIIINILNDFILSEEIYFIDEGTITGWADGTEINKIRPPMYNGECGYELHESYYSFDKNSLQWLNISEGETINDNENLACLRAYYTRYILIKKLRNHLTHNIDIATMVTSNKDKPSDRKVEMRLYFEVPKEILEKINSKINNQWKKYKPNKKRK